MKNAIAVKASIVDVEMSPDNKVAKVHVSVVSPNQSDIPLMAQ